MKSSLSGLGFSFPPTRKKGRKKDEKPKTPYTQSIIEIAMRIARLGIVSCKSKAQLCHNSFPTKGGGLVDITLIESYKPGDFLYLAVNRIDADGKESSAFSHLEKLGRVGLSHLSACDFALKSDLEEGEIVAQRSADQIRMAENLACTFLR